MLICSNCRFKFLIPTLNEKKLKKYYPSSGYYSYNKRSKLSVLYHQISSAYAAKKNNLLRFFFRPFSSLLYHYRIHPGKKLLEIGCGNGMQLEFYKKYGLMTNGLEPYGPPLTKKEEYLGIQRKSVKNAEFKENYFDYIVMKEVLEHIPDYKAVLKKCLKWLKSGGKIIIIVPNGDSLWARIFGRNWYGYDVPRHVCTYNPKNLKLLLEKIGFKINSSRKYDVPYMIDGSLKFYIADKYGNKKQNLIFSSLTKILLTPISLITTYLNHGSIIEIEAVKP